MKLTEELKSLRERSDEELVEELARAHQDQFKFRTDMALHSLANVKSIKTARKRVARILTLQRERELAGGGN
ncbi:MAG: 50S ribosomal protein L29 [Armatimonadota bacterium]|nr:50S ribosomal protein L29 [Armatimonadota bacterium]